VDKYQPIDCELHDRLEDAAVRRVPVQIELNTGIITGTVLDVKTVADEEFLVLKEQPEPIRLDRVIAVTDPAEQE